MSSLRAKFQPPFERQTMQYSARLMIATMLLLLLTVMVSAEGPAPETRTLGELEGATSASTADEGPSTDIETIRAAIEAADHSFNRAARERDREGFRALLSKDAIFFAGEFHRGRLEVLTIWQHLFDGKYDFRYEAESLETIAARSGELGWSLGRVKTSFTRPGLETAEVIEGHYMNVWTRTEQDAGGKNAWELSFSSALVVHPTLGAASDPRSGLMTAWPELADQIDAEIEIHWVPEATVRAESGELAYSFGEYEASFGHVPESDQAEDAATESAVEAPPDDGSKVSGKGHFLALWRKNEQGRWQLVAEGFTPPGIYGAE